jgi:translation initiation factor SUI1
MQANQIVIRLVRRGRRRRTVVENLDTGMDHKRVVKALKKRFSTNGRHDLVETTNGDVKHVIKLQGDMRRNVDEFLRENGIPEAMIKLVGEIHYTQHG